MNKKLTILAFLLCAVCGMFAQRKVVVERSISMFGVAVSVSDSVVYMTEIQDMPQMRLEKKTSFLLDRNEYSGQLSSYMKNKGAGRVTCITSFNKKRKKVEKRYEKIKQLYIKDGFFIRYVAKDDFAFIPVAEDTEE